MHRIFLLLLIFFSVNFLYSETNPKSITEIIENQSEYPLGLSMEILEDPSSELRFNDVLTSKNFTLSKVLVPNFGFTKTTYWAKFHLKNKSKQKKWFIHISYPLLDSIEFYSTKNQKWNKIKTGDTLSFDDRPMLERSFVFPIELEKNSLNTYYFRVQSEGTLQFPITVYSYEKFLEIQEKEQFALGSYYGILLVLVIYNLILLFMLQDRGYLYYLLYIINYGLSQSVLNGLAFQYLWPNYPKWANISLPFIGGFSLFWGLQFTRNFLNTKKIVPRLDTILLFLMSSMLFLMCCSFVFSYYVNIYLLAGLVILFAVSIFLVAIVCWDKGYKPARYFLIAWLSLLIGIFIYSFKGFGILPTNNFTEYGLQFGSAVEMCLLSLGLAYKIKLVNLERIRAEKIAVSYQEKLQEAKLVSSRLEIELLKNNIHPHFLLNSINATIAWLDEDPETAKQLLTALSEELRYILKLTHKKVIPIDEEIKICKRYLEIMSLRKEAKFQFKTIGIKGKESIPPITLLTLVENGVTHGFQGRKSGEFVLSKKLDSKKTKFILSNDGLPTNSQLETSGTGIKYIKSRLEEAFSGRWDFVSRPSKNGWESIISIDT
ncbi:MAG: 7TM diverse intracellular signaling domain-containing protein [Leptospiraceae bacterium]|nr:7TM diverse intracellular signaling domain-containing protein [Leptospiraceae bacterium]